MKISSLWISINVEIILLMWIFVICTEVLIKLILKPHATGQGFPFGKYCFLFYNSVFQVMCDVSITLLWGFVVVL